MVLTFEFVTMQIKAILCICFNFSLKRISMLSSVSSGFAKNHFSKNSVQHLISFAD